MESNGRVKNANSKKTSLGDRMKGYENVSRNYLIRRIPVIIRIDGVHFHTFTKGLEKPVDQSIYYSMRDTMFALCREIQGCKFGYVQSDEISLLLTDYDNLETSAWFDNNVNKLVSVSAAMTTMHFNKSFRDFINLNMFENQGIYDRKRDTAYFDARAFNIGKEEVCNYFIWREQDCIRNSIEALGRAYFSHKQLENINNTNIKIMLKEKHNVDWGETPLSQQRGVCAYRVPKTLENGKIKQEWVLDENTPIFSEDRDFIEKYL
jgi:tRNA(His) 5'-end guanylyltransferase